ncbi:MAG: HAD-IIIA family hydrolase, partial [Acidimicrobiales bacterium]
RAGGAGQDMSPAPPAATVGVTVVVPTVARPSLGRLLTALGKGTGPAPQEVLVIDDRRTNLRAKGLIDLLVGPHDGLSIRVLRSGGRGPAAARNIGWRESSSPWVAFLDDDVVPDPRWRADLARDLADLPWQVAGSQARLRVPLPAERRATDWERNVAALTDARWITADLAYRREALEEVGGFDERFPRAFREDADLGLRLSAAGYLVVRGARSVEHPVRAADRWVSVRLQAGNADDALMRARHGAGWRIGAGAGPSRNGRHLLSTLSLLAGVTGVLSRRRRLATASGAAWLAALGEFSAARIAPGPGNAAEVATMVATSAVIPPLAVAHQVRGWLGVPRLLRDVERAPLGQPRSPLALEPPSTLAPMRRRPRSHRVDVNWRPAAVLFDRDGTLVFDLPENSDPDRLVSMPGARAAVRRAREEGLAVGVVTNQAAIGRGVVTRAQVDAVNERVDAMFGAFDTWQVCPHVPGDSCRCRKPAPGLIEGAAAALGVSPADCAVVGDIGSDLRAASGAGARSVLVPTSRTLRREIHQAPVVAADLGRAVDLILASMC